ncbi:MAG: zinc metallopeptidase [Proteobacteria bacterium]|nr:zinc metallopeptidase [Pseudomonadota bacterium]
MRWRDGRRSDNVEDYRGRSSTGGKGSSRLGLKSGLAGLFLLAIGWYLGIDPRQLQGLVEGRPVAAPEQVEQEAPPPPAAPRDELGEFISVVLADTEDSWTRLFADSGATYIPPKLRYFEGSTESGCGEASAQSGPFYCPADSRVYIDLGFYRELAERFKAPGDFAQAYVIAHEVGHHVQNLLGTEEKVRKQQQGRSVQQRKALQVRMELQADCYAGIWAHDAQRSRHVLEEGDLEEALAAAKAVGDDMIQRQTQGTVMPETFTHGTAKQRQRWFKAGFASGQIKSCDTFRTATP